MGKRYEIFTKVRGVFRHQASTAWCAKGTILQARREPQNKYDNNAISLSVRGGLFFKRDFPLGYISRDIAEELAPLIDKGLRIEVFVLEVTGKRRGQERGVNILICYDQEIAADLLHQIERETAKAIAIDKARRSKEVRQIAQLEAERALARKQRREKLLALLVQSMRFIGLRIGDLLRYGFKSYMKLWKDPETDVDSGKASGVKDRRSS